jgi:hypothetical protein
VPAVLGVTVSEVGGPVVVLVLVRADDQRWGDIPLIGSSLRPRP